MLRRMLHHKIFECHQFSKLTYTERLLYIGLITIADDEGRFKLNAKYIKSMIFMYDRIGSKRIKNMINRVTNMNLINPYENDGELYGYHPNWKKYQIIRKDRQKMSSIPMPPPSEWQPNDNQMTTQDNIKENNKRKSNINHISSVLEGLGDRNPELTKTIRDAN